MGIQPEAWGTARHRRVWIGMGVRAGQSPVEAEDGGHPSEAQASRTRSWRSYASSRQIAPCQIDWYGTCVVVLGVSESTTRKLAWDLDLTRLGEIYSH